MPAYDISLVVAGVVVLGAAVVPRLAAGRPLSVPSVYVAFGFAVFSLPLGLEDPDPVRHAELAERLAELVVIVSIMGAGLRIDRPEGWRRWALTWRLLAVAMPLSIAGVALLGWGLLGLGPAVALLLGAALAPTDPVLASDVQVGGPREGDEQDVRFALTSEACLNDGLAFPFVNAALAAMGAASLAAWGGEWLLDDVVVRIGAGLAAGYAVGKVMALVTFRLPPAGGLAASAEGFVALALTVLAYGAGQLVHGYGFLSVFVAARVLRRAEADHEYHDILHGFADALERLLSAALLVLLGGSVAGGSLGHLDAAGVALGVLLVLVVRPLAGFVSLLGHQGSRHEHGAIAFFGIRGIGSAYYLAYAANHARLPEVERLWSVVVFVILLSVVLHGVSASPVMARLERRAEN